MKKVLFIEVSFLLGISGQAQNIGRVDSSDDINTIKRDTSFIYAESTMKDAVEAQSGAHAILELKLHDWLRSKHQEENADLLVSNSKEKWVDLLTSRGNYNRLFVYVRKSDVLPVVEVAPEEAEPEQQPVFEEVLVPGLTPDEEEMVDIDRFDQIEPYIMRMKEEKRIRTYGKYASLPEDVACHIFVYDRDGDVVAVLRQTEEIQHINLRTMREDNVRNYKNCGAIWFRLK